MRVNEFELYHNRSRGPLGVYIDHASLHAGFSNDGFHLAGNVVEAVMGGGGYVDGLLHLISNYFKMFNPFF